MPRALWRWQVDVEVADLSAHEQLAAVGLSPPAPDRRSWHDYQRVGEQLARAGWAGLLAPNAARPDGRVLCLFRDQHGVHGAKALSPPRHIDKPSPPPTEPRT